MLDKLRQAFRTGGKFSLLPFFLTAEPTNPQQVFLGGVEPEGLKLLHMTRTASEAELLRQVLSEAGFHIEYVASANTGVFGTTGSPSIYVRSDEFDEAKKFLEDYLAAEPMVDEPNQEIT